MKRQLFFVFVTFILSSVPLLIPADNESTILLLIHLSEALICSFSLFLYSDRPFSLFKIVHLFYLFFLCIAPMVQFKNNIVLWDGMPFTESDYIVSSFVLLCAILLYNAIYYLFYRARCTSFIGQIRHYLANPIIEITPLTIFEKCCFILLSIIILFFVLYINNFNILALFLRGGDLEEIEIIEMATDTSVPQSLNLVVVNFLRPMIITLFLSSYLMKARKLFVAIMFVFVLVIAFPTSMPRFSAAAMYIPILLVMSSSIRKNNCFVLSAVVGLLVIFPFLNNFRYFTEDTEITFGVDFGMFLEGHFDSYSSLLRIIKYDIVTYGRQLLGVLLFWVPRSIWMDKPIGSGAFLCDELHLSFDNISCCYFAEGYINAGFAGLLIFVLILAIMTALFDNTFWINRYSNHGKVLFFDVIYFFLLGLLFFMLRGDLLSSFAYAVGFVFSALSVYSLFYVLRKYVIKFL